VKQVIPYQAVHDLVSQVAKKFSGSPAIEYGHRRITYGELDAKAERLSGALSSLGVSA
jgi:non-ribosomal peptide synthetase component E (peptide arylation enzyme)